MSEREATSRRVSASGPAPAPFLGRADQGGADEVWQVRILFDGECPLCAREIAFLRRLDRGRGRIAFEDIAAPGHDPSVYRLDSATLMARIHGVLPDGTIIEGVEVFRRAYTAVGWGALVAPTRWPGIRNLAEAAYRTFARNRLRWTGRAPACEDGSCGLPPTAGTAEPTEQRP